MFHKSLILFLLTETPSLLALLGKGWSAWVAQFQSVADFLGLGINSRNRNSECRHKRKGNLPSGMNSVLPGRFLTLGAHIG